MLKTRLLNNGEVYIQGYGRNAHGTRLHQDLYHQILGNDHIKTDPTNNAIPQRNIQKLTGKRRNVDLLNYQVSHIWGRTKNPFLFEAPWNICFTPKLIDPFTGHEAKGQWPVLYQSLFFEKAGQRYRPFIDEYNSLSQKYFGQNFIAQYMADLAERVDEKTLTQFEKDARQELSPIIR
ncbi:MAG: hypothetical protein PHD32_03650 [Eubacteriales bacterium]|nr:hypothetical protein [Eubacteriales bacterium]